MGKLGMQKIIDVPFLSQKTDALEDYWQERSCAIVCLAMLINFLGKEAVLKEMVEKGQRVEVFDPELGMVGGHDPAFGWRHDAIVGLAKEYGLKASRTESDSIESLFKSIEKEKPVIINVHKDFDSNGGGHFVVLTGYKSNGSDCLGFYVNDPNGCEKNCKNLFIPIKKFERGWKKRSIYVKKVPIGVKE